MNEFYIQFLLFSGQLSKMEIHFWVLVLLFGAVVVIGTQNNTGMNQW